MEFLSILDKDFDWSQYGEYEHLLSVGQDALLMRDLPQRVLGKITNHLEEVKNIDVETIAKDLGVPYHSLRTYAWVEKRIGDLEVPLDLPWSALRVIAGTDHPEAWVTRVMDEGLSVAELKREIAIFKGEEPKEKKHKHELKCTHCGLKNEPSLKCEGCGHNL